VHWKYVCLSGGVRPTWQVTYILMGLEFLLRTQERGNLTSWHEKIYAGSFELKHAEFCFAKQNTVGIGNIFVNICPTL
jgi:hypothetical protein